MIDYQQFSKNHRFLFKLKESMEFHLKYNTYRNPEESGFNSLMYAEAQKLLERFPSYINIPHIIIFHDSIGISFPIRDHDVDITITSQRVRYRYISDEPHELKTIKDVNKLINLIAHEYRHLKPSKRRYNAENNRH